VFVPPKKKIKKKKRVFTLGIEPKTNGLLDQRSTNWAMRTDAYGTAGVDWNLEGKACIGLLYPTSALS
jgi:hypothetical protein